MYRHILVPVDDSPLSMKAMREAAKLARACGARISAVHSIAPFRMIAAMDVYVAYPELYSPEDYRRSAERYANKFLAKAGAIAKSALVRFSSTFVTGEQPWRVIVDTARKKRCDLIVMASHGRRGLAAVVLGSETTKVLTHSKKPVLICR